MYILPIYIANVTYQLPIMRRRDERLVSWMQRGGGEGGVGTGAKRVGLERRGSEGCFVFMSWLVGA